MEERQATPVLWSYPSTLAAWRWELPWVYSSSYRAKRSARSRRVQRWVRS
jgi:hypothetical protein